MLLWTSTADNNRCFMRIISFTSRSKKMKQIDVKYEDQRGSVALSRSHSKV